MPLSPLALEVLLEYTCPKANSTKTLSPAIKTQTSWKIIPVTNEKTYKRLPIWLLLWRPRLQHFLLF